MSDFPDPVQRVGVTVAAFNDERDGARPRRVVFRFGIFELDVRTGELRKQGRLVHLRHQPVNVLRMLLERPGDLVTRRDITTALWPDDVDIDVEQGLNHCMKEIRAALGDRHDSPRFIETLSRRGYRFLGDVHEERQVDAPLPIVPARTVEIAPARRDEPIVNVRVTLSRPDDSRSLWSGNYARRASEADLLELDVAAGLRSAVRAAAALPAEANDQEDGPARPDRRFE
jgi:DNA-binding winged helix-turn-helix (wHTH) protein